MKKALKYFPVSLFLLLTTNLFAQTKHESLHFKLDQYFSALTGLKNFNGNVIIAKAGKVILDKTYNMPRERDSLKVTRESKFIIASVSKVFIKYSILKLAELNKLKLSDKLNKFIPGFPNGDRITVEQLMHHQSGLPRELSGYDKYDSLSLNKVVELAKLEKLQFEPGTETLYSNVGYFLLHAIIDKTADNGYLPFIQKEILQKTNLKNTGEFNATKTIPNFAYGFDNDNGKIVATSKKSINRYETGNFFSTIGDLYSFSSQMLNGVNLDRSAAMEMFGKDSVLIQAGGRPGYRAYLYKNVKTGVDFIFVSNYTDIPIQEMTADIINILDNKPYEVPHRINRKEIILSEELMKKYIGKFSLEADYTQTFSITINNKKLYITDKDGEKSEMKPDSETTFFDDPASKDGYEFTFNQQTGKYDLAIISTGLKLKAKRIE